VSLGGHLQTPASPDKSGLNSLRHMMSTEPDSLALTQEKV